VVQGGLRGLRCDMWWPVAVAVQSGDEDTPILDDQQDVRGVHVQRS
jgi:hypothetical protein